MPPVDRKDPGPGAGSQGPLGRGFRIGEYVIVDTLGHGSMATVFLARDNTGHEVALKIFQEGPGISPTLLERFKREAEAAKKLRKHPNIMKVYATGHEGIYHYIVMEPVPNSPTLEDLLEAGSLTLEKTVQIVIKIARALHFAHTHNIIHRDVKPSNIMMNEFGEPLLTDFGVAALIDWPSFTVSGALTGTPLYMSPEQARSERVGVGTDVYSLGVVLYEALTGVLPYSTQHASPVKAVLEAVKQEAPKRPRALRREITPGLESVILKALEKNPSHRYADAEEFAHDLERALTGTQVEARPYSRSKRLWRLTAGRERALISFVALLVVTIGSFLFQRGQQRALEYENLVLLAQTRNREAIPAFVQPSAASKAIRDGRRNMMNENWTVALRDLENAIQVSEAGGDQRTAALARLEQARCELVRGNAAKALTIYQAIIDGKDTASAVADLALLEAIQQLVLDRRTAEAAALRGQHDGGAEGPIADAISCLAGDLPVEKFIALVPEAPKSLQNDLQLTAAIRLLADGQKPAARQRLQRALQESTPRGEWPAPIARQLFEATSR